MIQLLYWGCAWICVSYFIIFSLYQAIREGITYVKRLHQVPCHRCAFFTGDYRLKCTVHPFTAFSEDAIDCRDFEVTSSPAKYCQKKACSK